MVLMSLVSPSPNPLLPCTNKEKVYGFLKLMHLNTKF